MSTIKRPRISVAIATFNGAAFIREQLESIVAQTLPPDEIVICDDRSDDDTVVVIDDFRNACGIRIRREINNRRLGVVRNFERALSLCGGDIIFLSDQDDVWDRSKVMRVVREFESHGEAMVITNDQIISNEDLSRHGPRKSENIRRLGLAQEEMCTGCCTALRREFLEIAIPFFDGWFHDNWISRLAVLLGVKRFLNEPLQFYRRHQSNTSQWVASSIGGITWGAMTRARTAQDIRVACERRISINQALEARLLERGGWLSARSLDGAARKAVGQIRQETLSLARRIWITTLGPFARILPIAKLWWAGGYDQFRGWRTAVRDLIR